MPRVLRAVTAARTARSGWRGVVGATLVLVAAACQRLPDDWLFVTSVTDAAATVVWTGDAIANIDCDGPGVERPAGVVRHRRSGVRSLRLEGLTAGTVYTCRAQRRDGSRQRRVRFRTASAIARSFTFAAVGDSGDGSVAARRVARRILATRPAFLVHLGDFAYPRGTPSEFDERFFAPYRRVLARVPLFPTPGNHDLTSGSCYDEIFAPVVGAGGGPVEHYAFDWEGARFFSLRYTGLMKGNTAGAKWLSDELAATPPSSWRVVFLHQPISTTVLKGTELATRTAREVMERGRVNLVLAGHAHLYERAVPSCRFDPAARVLSVTSGGGGSATLDVPRPHENFPRAISAPHFLRVRVGIDWIDVWAVGVRGQVLDHVRHGRSATVSCRADGWGGRGRIE
jgi:hypothetical protein